MLPITFLYWHLCTLSVLSASRKNSEIKQVYINKCEAASVIFTGMGTMYWSDWSWGWRNRFYSGVFWMFFDCVNCLYPYAIKLVPPTPRPIRPIRSTHTGEYYTSCCKSKLKIKEIVTKLSHLSRVLVYGWNDRPVAIKI